MKKNKNEVQKNEKLYDVYCPACGQFIKTVKKPKHTKKFAFECKKCTARFTLTFPGTEERDDNRPRGI